MSRGRPPLGRDIVEHCDADPDTKRRLRLLLQTIAGELSVADACQQLGISQTRFFELRAEMLQGALDSLRPKPRGRPLRTAYVTDRNQVIHLLDCLSPHVGSATLELFFPLMARRELRRLLRRYRRVWRKRDRLRLHQLRWHRPGAVWAIDYTQAPAPIDNIYASILVVRDLASGYQLLALPTTDQSSKTACDAILPLFRQFDPPLNEEKRRRKGVGSLFGGLRKAV